MNIRNFCIIAHIDHGKSTLADRFLEITGTMSEREMTHSQILDTMDLEQERGITIKLQPARMIWHAPDANPELNELNQKIAIKRSRRFILNLIDTPGHVDFQYEVSRSLAACEGAVLVVDASQGIEAQTLSNVHLAIEQGLEIIPVINKIDLSVADPDKVEREMIDLFGFKKSEILRCSAKTGAGVSEILDAICEKVPDPSLNTSYKQYAKTKTDLNKSTALALIFDSFYDSYQGVIALVRVFNGRFNDHEKVLFCGTKKELETTELGYLLPARSKQQLLDVGEVGYLVTGAKDIHDVRVGDTITSARNPGLALPGYKKVTPMVYAGLFTIDSSEYENLRDALDKLSLNDASLSFEPESSQALGFGFRVGFLGLLHMEIVQERLEREYDLELIATTPSVNYEIVKNNGDTEVISNPAKFPDRAFIEEIREPFVRLEVITPHQYLGGIFELLAEKHGISQGMEYIDQERVIVRYEIPLAGIITDFYDRLKSISRGYASVNYEAIGFRANPLEKMDILVTGEPIDSLSLVVHKEDAHRIGLHLVKKLKEIIPRANFVISLQAAIGAKILARENIPAFRKDVTAKLYGGDQTRKDKLLKKQKAGKRRMKSVGRVNLPQEAFLAILKK